MKQDYFEDFKPIRNRLRKICLFNVLEYLYVLRQNKKPYFVTEVYEFVYTNALIYCSDIDNNQKDNNQIIHKILTETTNLNNTINVIEPNDDPFSHYRKKYLNQERSKVFSHYYNQIYRYYTIFSTPKLSKHIEKMIGMPYYDFVLCSIWLHLLFMNTYHIRESYLFNNGSSHSRFNNDNMRKVLDLLSIPCTKMQEILKSEVKYDKDSFVLNGKQHIKTPVISYNGHLICFYKDILLKQFTAGIYYTAEIPDTEHNLNNEFGQGFEKYIGIILQKLNSSNRYTIHPEITYKKGGCKTSDWIVENQDEIIFIECKTKRQQFEEKKLSASKKTDEYLFQRVAKEVSQIYKVFDDYQKGLIPNFPFIPNKKVTPIIVYLEDGMFMDISNLIAGNVKDILSDKKIATELVEKYPFHSFSCNKFEHDIQIMFELGFNTYFSNLKLGKISPEYIENFNYINYFSNEFESDFLTPNE